MVPCAIANMVPTSIPTRPSRFSLTFRDYTRAPFEPQPMNANASSCHESRPHVLTSRDLTFCDTSHPCVDGLARGRWVRSAVAGCVDEWCASCAFDAVPEGEARHCMRTRWPWLHFVGDSHMRNLFDGAHARGPFACLLPTTQRTDARRQALPSSQAWPRFSAAPAEATMAMPRSGTTPSASASSEARASPTSSAAR